MDHGSRKQKILIVDDEPDNIKILAEVLADDYTLFGATNGKEAIKCAIGKEKPDLILLDVVMPHMNGYEVLKVLKADSRTRDIPVVFITVMGRELNELRGFKLGAVDYIMKPFSPAIVSARVRIHLELKHYRDYLESIIQKRTKELAVSNKRLRKEIMQRRQAEELLEEQIKQRTKELRQSKESLRQSEESFRQSEESFRQSEESLRILLNAIRESATLIDIKGTVLQANETAALRLHTTVDKLVGASIYDFLPHNISEERKKCFKKVIHTGRPLCFEDVCDGRRMNNTVCPVFDDKRKISRLAIFSVDSVGHEKNGESGLRESEPPARFPKRISVCQ
ncbi:response regulator [Desulfobacterales bacterium HSG2]|nr:response regulator [Desulfobacterales bacterium HSG2]